MLTRNLPGYVALVLPPAVFAAALNGPGLVCGGRVTSIPHYWTILAVLSVGAYALVALVEPIFSTWTGSDAALPSSLLRSAKAARAAAEAATGSEAARQLRRAGRDFTELYVPISNAAFVVVAGALGDMTGRLTRAMSTWLRYVTRWLSGGLLVAAFWIPAILADELVAYDAAWEGLLLVLPLCLPLVIAVILSAVIRPSRGPTR